MLSSKLTNEERKAIYRRDGFACALCGNGRYLQIHHLIPRGEGGKQTPHNVITLCSTCHGHIHGVVPLYADVLTVDEVKQMALEYLADLYADQFDPWRDCVDWFYDLEYHERD